MKIYPNPADWRFFVEFELEHPQELSIELLDAYGKILSAPISQQWFPYGHHRISIDVSALLSGVYLCRMKFKNYSYTKKIILAK